VPTAATAAEGAAATAGEAATATSATAEATAASATTASANCDATTTTGCLRAELGETFGRHGQRKNKRRGRGGT
jgi:hypothetical protein